jgi:hypothetical protein
MIDIYDAEVKQYLRVSHVQALLLAEALTKIVHVNKLVSGGVLGND